MYQGKYVLLVVTKGIKIWPTSNAGNNFCVLLLDNYHIEKVFAIFLLIEDNDFTLDLDNTVYALDASTIEFVSKCFQMGKVSQEKRCG